jgi:hypothetical protein
LVAMVLRFYLDENLPIEIARQLIARGIDAITVRDMGWLGDADINHLKRATEMGRVLCTYDSDFLKMAAEGMEHAGIVFGRPESHYIGEWVKYLSLMHAICTTEEMHNRVEYL